MSTPQTSLRTIAIINEHAGGGAMADVFRRLEHPLRDAIGDFGEDAHCGEPVQWTLHYCTIGNNVTLNRVIINVLFQVHL